MALYLDNAASSHPKPETVYRANDETLRKIGANPGRSGHQPGMKAAQVIARTRLLLAQLFAVEDPNRLVFTSNATEALNLGLKGLLNPGDHVLTSSMEHNSVIRPLRTLEAQGVEVTVIPCDDRGRLKSEKVAQGVRKNTRLIVLTHASNVTGGLLPIAEVGAVARQKGILFMVDAAQTAGVIPISVKDMGVDLLAAPGHKGLLGPQGTGFLYIGPGVRLRPLKEGGTGSRSEEEFQPEFLPDQMEAGTLNTPGLAGLGAGIEFLLKQGLERIRDKERALSRILWQGLKGLPRIRLYGPEEVGERTSALSFNIEGLNPAAVASILDTAYDIAVRAGLHCAPLAHRTLGTFPEGTVRVSPGYFNSEEDIAFFLEAVESIIKKAG